MTKTEAIQRAGGRKALAELLGIKRQAVERWPGDSIPALRVYQLREKRPWWFRAAPKPKEAQA